MPRESLRLEHLPLVLRIPNAGAGAYVRIRIEIEKIDLFDAEARAGRDAGGTAGIRRVNL